jgi:hypothetical protein
MNRQAQIEAEERAAERRRRENRACRLRSLVSRIVSLRLEIQEYRRGGITPLVSYTRHIVVERAPALFDIGCTDAECSQGGHDLTNMIMDELRASSTDFGGEDKCYGRRYGEPCGTRLKYHAHATYGAP